MANTLTANTLTIEYDNEVLLSLGVSREQFTVEAKFLLAAKLYELGRLTSGQSAKLSGKSRVEFLFLLSKIGVSISNLNIEELETELNFASNTSNAVNAVNALND
jgi:predicted HTH domain antitoxin